MIARPIRLAYLTPGLIAAAAGGIAALTLALAWAFEVAGYAPCELCLKERVPYDAGMVAAAVAVLANGRRPNLTRAALVALSAFFAAGTVLGVYHVGVEARLWTGPTECAGAFAAPAKASDFFKSLDHVSVVRCDQPSLFVAGLSLATWNALISAALTALAVVGLVRARARAA